ncbi:MAG: EamA family transporter [Verrucomicrobiae bacterium]|nr:EamA family transporter [Verrucomicrobiae bacterium]
MKKEPWYFNAYLHCVLCIALVTASELCLKIGANQSSDADPLMGWLGLSSLGSAWVWMGIACLILNFLSWLVVLKRLPLTIAYNIVNLNYVFVILGSALILGEEINPTRWLGALLVVAGIFIIIRPMARLEERI